MKTRAHIVRHAIMFLLLLAETGLARTRVKPIVPAGAPAPHAPRTTAIAGEDFASAIVIPSLPFSTSGTTCGYLDDGYLARCGNYDGPDVVYAFTAPSEVHVRAALSDPGGDSYVNVFEDDRETALACSEPGGAAVFARMRAGHTYYFVVDELGGIPCGSYSLTVDQQSEPKVGQTMAEAIPISALPFHTKGSTDGYGGDYLLECTQPGSPDIVYSLAPSSPICVDISTCPSGFYTSVGVYENLDGPLIECDDYYCDDEFASARVDAVTMRPGNTYFIVVTGFGGEFGPYALNVDPCAATASHQTTWGRLKAHYR